LPFPLSGKAIASPRHAAFASLIGKRRDTAAAEVFESVHGLRERSRIRSHSFGSFGIAFFDCNFAIGEIESDSSVD
jgi:hypothetical protein